MANERMAGLVPKEWVAAVALVGGAVFAASGATAVSMVLRPKAPAVVRVADAEGVTIDSTVIPKTIRVIPIARTKIVERAPMEPEKPQPPAIPVAPVTQPELTPAVEPEPRIERHRRRYAEAGDVCARHHLHKVIVGRGWRCR